MDLMIGSKVELFSGDIVKIIDIKVRVSGIYVDYVTFTGKKESGEVKSFSTRAILREVTE